MDDSVPSVVVASKAEVSPAGIWLGMVVPKRHAKRSVTRNLIKREMRSAVDRAEPGLLPGLWVIRLRSTIDRKVFPSAASTALKQQVRTEMSALLSSAASRLAAR